jgi:hypothetical protein
MSIRLDEPTRLMSCDRSVPAPESRASRDSRAGVTLNVVKTANDVGCDGAIDTIDSACDRATLPRTLQPKRTKGRTDVRPFACSGLAL